MTRLENITKYMMALLTALIVTTLYAPKVLTIFFSFYKTRKGQVNWESFSYEPYTKLIFERQILECDRDEALVDQEVWEKKVLQAELEMRYYLHHLFQS